MVKFDKMNNCFVHVGSHGGAVAMVFNVRDGLVPRYDLQLIDGSLLHNIGEYELTLATETEVMNALAKEGK